MRRYRSPEPCGVMASACGLWRRASESTSLYAAAAAVSSVEPIFLRHHFRSHPHIAQFASTTFYGGALAIDTAPTLHPAGFSMGLRSAG